MTELKHPSIEQFRSEWQAEPTLPLEVLRARYESPMPRSWEVLAHFSPSWQAPIAEFSEWAEAMQFANEQAGWASSLGIDPATTRAAIAERWANQ